MKKYASKIFNRDSLIRNREIALQHNHQSVLHDFSAQGMIDNLQSIKKYFHNIAIIGSSAHFMLKNSPQSKRLR